jgi:hypothetical protein
MGYQQPPAAPDRQQPLLISSNARAAEADKQLTSVV